jgi:glutaredoxin
MDKIEVYGADWCDDTRHALRHLDELGVDYQYVNIEEDSNASEWVKSRNDGKEIKPTIKVGDEVLRAPGDEELESALRNAGLLG